MVISSLGTGGAQRVASNMAIGLPKDCQVDFLLNDKEDIYYPYRGRIIDLGMKPQKNKLSVLYQGKVFFKRVSKLRYLKRTEKYDAVYSFLDSANIANILSGKRYCKTVISIHSKLSAMGFEWRYKYIVFPLIRMFYKYADYIVTVSKGVEQDLRENIGYKKDNVYTIYNGFDVEGIRSKAKQPLPEKYDTIFEGYKTLISVGRLNVAKGYWHLIRAMKEVVKKDPKIRLVILGEGEQEAYLKGLCRDLELENNIKFVEFQDNPFNFIRRADIFVMSSIFEGLPSSLIEALAVGKACVATDFQSGAREILAPEMELTDKSIDKIIEAKYGILTPVCDGVQYDAGHELTNEEKMLADAIVMALVDKELRERYSQKSNECVQKYSIENMITEWCALIE